MVKGFLRQLLHIGIIAFRSVLLKEVHRLFMCSYLLIGICFVKILCGRTVDVVDEFLMLCISIGGQSTLISLVFTMLVSSSVVFE